MRALVVERKPVRFAAARIASELDSGRGAKALLRLKDLDPLPLPSPEWVRVRPRLAGICGSDLATVDGRSSRWFESVVSFPFVPGHEVVGELEDGSRVVVEPVLGCAPRGLDACRGCASGEHDRCERLHAGALQAGLQTGYCADTGGGWAEELLAHPSQLHAVPDELDDPSAVMVEPLACGIHAALSTTTAGGLVAVLGAGTLGLAVIAGLAAYGTPATLIAGARYPEQKAWAKKVGATTVVNPGELKRAVRRASGSFELANGTLTGGADVVFDCVGSSASITDAIAMTRPGGTVVLVGMAAAVDVDLTPLWQKQVRLQGAYAYGTEPACDHRRTFALALELVPRLGLGALVGATYPLDRFSDAIEHAAHAGARGTVKVCFEHPDGKRSSNKKERG